MQEFMSIDDVFRNYLDEWVLLDELETQDNLSVQGGRVVGHDPERSALEQMAIEMRLEKCVIVCRKQKDGRDAIRRDYAVSPIVSFEEIEAELAKTA